MIGVSRFGEIEPHRGARLNGRIESIPPLGEITAASPTGPIRTFRIVLCSNR